MCVYACVLLCTPFFKPAGFHTNILCQEKHVLILVNLHAMLGGCSVIPVDVGFYTIIS